MKGLCKIALVTLVVAACGGDAGITEPVAPTAPPVSGGILALGMDSTTRASIETNKDDYAPGEVVHLVGRGWAPGETVNLHMTEEPNTHADVDTNVVADASGGFSTHFYDVQMHDIGVAFKLTATGGTSGSVAVATFTDGIISAATIQTRDAATCASAMGSVAVGSSICAFSSFTVSGGGATHAQLRWLNPSGVITAISQRAPSFPNGTSGAQTYSASHTPNVAGTWTVLLCESDNVNVALAGCSGSSLRATQTFTVTAPTNTAPSLTDVPTTAQSIPELALYTFDANATDTDVPAQTLTFSIVGSLPTGATFNTATGVFEWTPTEAQGPSGPHTFSVRVSDGIANTDQSVTLNVTEVNVAPTLTGVPTTSQSIPELALYTFDANASDTDLPVQTLTFSIVGSLPLGATFNAATGVFEWTPTEAQGPSGPHTFTVRVSDGTANTDQLVTLNVLEVNQAPVLGAIGAKSVDEGSELTFTATATDADLPQNTLMFSLGGGAPSGASIDANTGVFTWTPPDGPATVQITIIVTDNGSPSPLSDNETITVTVDNVPPSIGTINAPLAPVAVGTNNVTVTWNFTDPGAENWTCSIEWDSGMGFTSATYVATKSCSATASLTPGLYTVTVKVDDGDVGGTDTETLTTYIVVYDPSGGFVTGGGWFNSIAGYYRSNLLAQGKATFGFVSKYQPGRTVPTGNTEFQFHAGDLNFKSTVYEWLVVAGTKAMYKGEGTIAGRTGVYGFLLSAIDGSPDKFRIKIWEKTSGEVVYDTLPEGAADDADPATTLGGGSIVVHTKK